MKPRGDDVFKEDSESDKILTDKFRLSVKDAKDAMIRNAIANDLEAIADSLYKRDQEKVRWDFIEEVRHLRKLAKVLKG